MMVHWSMFSLMMNPETLWKAPYDFFPSSWFFIHLGPLQLRLGWNCLLGNWVETNSFGSMWASLSGGQQLREPSTAVLTGGPFASYAQHFTGRLHYQHPHSWFIPLHSHKQGITRHAYSWHVSFESRVRGHTHQSECSSQPIYKRLPCLLLTFWCATNDYQTVWMMHYYMGCLTPLQCGMYAMNCVYFPI